MITPTTPPGGKPVERGAPERRDLHRLGAERPVADDVGRAGLADVEHRQAVDVHSDLGEQDRDRRSIGAGRLDRAHRRLLVKPGERLAGRESGPFGRPHAGDPAALLVDQDRKVVAAVEVPKLRGQRAQLLAELDVAPEDDVADGIGVAEKGPLVGGEGEPGWGVDGGLHGSG